MALSYNRGMTATPDIQPRLDHVTCASPAGMHRMAYREWGDPDNDRVVLCVHGLTRSGRDFDPLARRMAGTHRVVCPDIVGRGRSDWLIDPAYYAVPQYVSDLITLVARLRPARLDWVGTSMGGLIALGMVAGLVMSRLGAPQRGAHGLPDDDRLALGRVVLNDIGPHIQTDGLERIADYVGQPVQFERFEDAVAYVRSTSAEFGPHDDAGWRALTENVFIQDDGKWTKHYDLRIAEPMGRETPETLAASEQLLWTAFDALSAPVLIVRGAHSDLLSEDTLEQMLARNPQARAMTVPGVGHAPTLRSADQLEPVCAFLRGTP